MKIPSKTELQQFTFIRSSNIDSKDIMNLYNKCAAPCSFLVTDTTLASIIFCTPERIFYKEHKNNNNN